MKQVQQELAARGGVSSGAGRVRGPVAAAGSLFSHAETLLKKGGELWKKGIKRLLPNSGDSTVTR